MKKNSLVVFLHHNVWDQSSLEALEVEKFYKYSNVVAYEMGHFINKNIVYVFKNKLNKKYIKKTQSFFEWKTHFLGLIKNYKFKNILIINKVKPNNIWGLLVLYELSKLKINIVEYRNSGIPEVFIKKTFFEKIKIAIDVIYVLNSLQKRFYYLLSKFLKFYNYSYLISGNQNKQLKKKKIIYGSSWDMTKTFNRNKKLNINYQFAVYIESTIGHAGDQIILGPNAARVDKEKWFKSLNKFFDIFEKKYNLKVIIAAHPKVNHKGNVKFYNHRKVLKNKTKELVFNAKFVFFEKSTAINYIIKFNKPAVMIYNKDSISTSYNKKIHLEFSKLTGINNLDIENYSVTELENSFEVKKSKYFKYYKEFINYKNLKLPNYQILKNKFLNNLND
jgi:hypothetical protein